MMNIQPDDKRSQSTSGRQRIVLLSALCAIFLPLPITILVCLPIAKKIGNTQHSQGILGVAVLIAIVFVAVAMIIGTLWTIGMSFYLPVEEFKVIAQSSEKEKRIPMLTPLSHLVANKVLEWKMRREQ